MVQHLAAYKLEPGDELEAPALGLIVDIEHHPDESVVAVFTESTDRDPTPEEHWFRYADIVQIDDET